MHKNIPDKNGVSFLIVCKYIGSKNNAIDVTKPAIMHTNIAAKYFLFLRRLPKDLLKKMKQFMLIDISNNKRY